MTDMTIANEIARQIGSRAFFMMGTRYKLGDEKSLTFDLRGSLAVNKIKVEYDYGRDTYKLHFWKQGRAPNFKIVVVAELDDVYCDQLHEIIERNTGLALSL